MVRKWISAISERLWLRVTLAVALLIVGLAPVGAPILSDSTFRQALRPAATSAASPSFSYRWLVQPDGSSRVQRSNTANHANTWEDLGTLPETVAQLEPVGDGSGLIYARTKNGIWRSDDSGAHWTQLQLPSRPLSLAVARHSEGMVFVGSESMGLYRSNDQGAHWQAVGTTAMSVPGGALGVSSVTVNPDDERVVYAAPGYWLGSTELHFSPGTPFASTDGGTTWFSMVTAAPTTVQNGQTVTSEITRLVAVPDRPLAVTAVAAAPTGSSTATISQQFDLVVTPQLVAGLDNPDRNLRAATARTLGLAGDHSTVPALLAHLHDTDLYVGDQVAEAIGRLNDPSTVEPLLAALKDKDEAVQERAAYALGMLKARDAVPQLATLLDSGGPLVQSRAAEALAAIATPEAVSALMVPLADEQLTPKRNAAMDGIEQAGQAAVGPLTAALSDGSPATRRNAAEMLGYVRAPAATSKLAVALADVDPQVRTEAAWALGEIGTADAQQALARAARSEKQQSVLGTIQQALAQAQESRATQPTLGEALMLALTQVPLSRWTFLSLLVVLAAVLLAAGPNQLKLRRQDG